jgi:uncharacterized protein DUF3732
MTIQIRKIMVYGKNGQRRDVEFVLGALNIVTGGSRTGKSALLAIVDYVWGRDECTFPEGPARRALAWFGLLLDRGGEAIFLARRNPDVGAKASDEFHLQRAVTDAPASATGLAKNMTAEAVRALLGELLGISENEHRPADGGTRAPVSASARHAIAFCIQDQDEIDSRANLFHRQGESGFLAQAIKDTLPYFLGAVDAQTYRLQLELDAARKRRRQPERDRGLLVEAKRAQLLPPDAMGASRSEIVQLLNQAQQKGEADGALVLSDPHVDVSRLHEERAHLRDSLRGVQDEEMEIERLLREGTAYAEEAREQQARLAAVGLVGDKDAEDHLHCPLCNSAMATSTPTVSDVSTALRQIGTQLETVARDRPQIEAHRGTLAARREALEEHLRNNARLTRDRVAESSRLQAQQALFLEQARALARIGFYLETAQEAEGEGSLSRRLQEVVTQIDQLEASLDPEALEERIASALNLVGQDMTRLAQDLDLEHGSRAIRLDRKRLTLIADTNDGPIPLAQIGSGENWIGYHVVAHLALHKLFVDRQRPVPAFLMLDQPSQSQYPADPEEGKDPPAKDEDRMAVSRLFQTLHAVAVSLAPKLQVIVVDHVDFKEEWFQSAVRARWRGGEKLVPESWIIGS